MIAAAAQTNVSHLSANWFDAVVVVMLGLGLFRGHKNGMSKEVVPLFQWLMLVIISGWGYKIAAQVFINAAGMDKTVSYVLAYIILALVVYLIFAFINRAMTKKVETSNFFGAREFYFGMPAGMIRFACILVALLAVLNAPFYSKTDVEVHKIYMRNTYGGGEYSGNYLPDLQTVQAQVFKESFSGPYIKKYLGTMLIGATAAGQSGGPNAPQKPRPVIYMGNMK
jgi:uncharacterized membrane protein required for colicin V production